MADGLPEWMGLMICGFIVLLFLFWFVRGFCRFIGNGTAPPPKRQKPAPKPQNDVRVDVALFLANHAWKQGKKHLFKKKPQKKKRFWEK